MASTATSRRVNFGQIYGAGVIAQTIGQSVEETRAIVAEYDRRLPFVRALSRLLQDKAERLGHTELMTAAPALESIRGSRGLRQGRRPISLEEALRRIRDRAHPWYGQRASRADVYTALNALIQGTAARMTKAWMSADRWRAGIVPMLQLHDCLDCSVTSPEQGELVARLGEEAVKLEVPMRVDVKYGRSWGDAKHTWEELHGTAPAPKPAPKPQPKPAPKPTPEPASEPAPRAAAQARA